MRTVSLFIAAALAASPASAAYINKTIPVGGALKGMGYTALNPDCSSMGYPTVRIVSGATNGTVSTGKGRIYPYYAPANPRHACITRQVTGTVLSYRPQNGFAGSDSFTVEIFFPSGNEQTDTFNITVK